jgi:hypothetical protein
MLRWIMDVELKAARIIVIPVIPSARAAPGTSKKSASLDKTE